MSPNGIRNRRSLERSTRAAVIYAACIAGVSLALFLNPKHLAAAPLNDNFADRIQIQGTAIIQRASNVGASKEPGEPDHAGNSGGKSVWWTWMAPGPGEVAVTTTGSSFDTLLAVYVGENLASLTQIAANDQNPISGNTSQLRFTAQAGTLYQLVVDGFSAEVVEDGEILLTLEVTAPPPQPANDNFSQAAVISGGSGSVDGSLLGATLETNEPKDPLQTSHSTWWKWTAPATGTLSIAVTNQQFQPRIWVYTGESISDLVWDTTMKVGGESGRYTESFLATVEPGIDYWISVSTRPGEMLGSYTLSWAFYPPPENDAFNNRTPVSGATVRFFADLRAASRELDELNHAGFPAARSVWWTWTAPASGPVKITAEAAIRFGVYWGSSLVSLISLPDGVSYSVAGQTDAPSLVLPWVSHYDFEASAGTTYQIAASADSALPAAVEMNLQLVDRPVNDQFSDRISLLESAAVVHGSNIGATQQAGEPDHTTGPFRSVWYSWMAPSSGVLRIRRSGDRDLIVAVYSGSSLATLAREDGGLARDEFDLPVIAGAAYQIAVAGTRATTGNFMLNLNFVPRPENDDFDRRIHLSGSMKVLAGSTAAATRELNEPLPAQLTAGHSVWWSWVAPFAGEATVFVDGAGFPAAAFVYTGESLNGLSLIGDNDQLNSRVTDRVFRAGAGQVYQIAIDRFADIVSGSPATGEFVLPLILKPFPSNDDFVNAELLTGPTHSVTIINSGATSELNEPAHSGASAAYSVWWRWTAPLTGGARLVTAPLLRIAVYTGSQLENLITVASGDAHVSFKALAGTTYSIAVDAASRAAGATTLQLSCEASPPNDDFINRLELNGSNVAVSGSNAGATREPAEPSNLPGGSAASVWWSWTAPNSGPILVDTEGSEIDAAIGVYTGATLPELLQVASISRSSAYFDAEGGTTYQLVVDGMDGQLGQIQLTVSAVIRLPDAQTGLTTWQLGSSRPSDPARILDVLNLHTRTNSDDSVSFSGTVVIGNTSEIGSKPLRLHLIARAGVSRTESAGLSLDLPPDALLDIDPPAGTLQLAPGTAQLVDIRGRVPAPTPPSENSGLGWKVFAVLNEESGGNWRTIDSNHLLTGVWPQVSGFAGPGGGVIRLEPADPSTPLAGRISVSLGPPEAIQAGAGWRLNRSGAFGNPLFNLVAVGMPIEIEFKHIHGWLRPENRTVIWSKGEQQMVVDAKYRTGTLEIHLEPEQAVQDGAGWRFDTEPNFTHAPELRSVLFDEAVTVQFKSVPGWISPRPQTLTMQPEDPQMALTGLYKRVALKLTRTENDIVLQIDAVPGTCEIQFSPQLPASTWQTLRTIQLSDDQESIIFPATVSGGFFRVRWTE